MSPLKSYLDLYKHLPQTNCKKCGMAACLAFAAAAMRGQKSLSACPDLDPQVREELAQELGQPADPQEEMTRALAPLKARVATVDLAAKAGQLGCAHNGKRLVLKCLGKDFTVDPDGTLASQCHVNAWLAEPMLNYVSLGQGKDPVGRWKLLRELPGGEDWQRLFAQRCEKPLQKVIDEHRDLMEWVIDIFGAQAVEEEGSPELGVVLHPLPKLPLLIRYWPSEDGLESTLNLCFDATATDNLPVESIYTLGVGLVTMLEKIALTHDT
jgi:hypothetical protein